MKLLVKDTVNKIIYGDLDCTGFRFLLVSRKTLSANKSMQSLGECSKIHTQRNLDSLCPDLILFDDTKKKTPCIFINTLGANVCN